MAGFDYDVIIIGSGFGGSVAALRTVEKGYSVGVLEAGKRWRREDVPKSSWDVKEFAWQPEAELFGMQRIRYLDDVMVLSGSGVGGGSLVYANTLYYPHDKFFAAPEWSTITDWKDETAPYYDQCQRMFGVMPSPYMDSDGDRIVRSVCNDMKRPYVRAPLAIHFGTPGVEVEDPYFGGVGPKRTGCVSCGDCMIGCGRGAKNMVTENYLYLAEKLGVTIHELQEVYELQPLKDGGYEVLARHPGWAQRAVAADHRRFTAEQVVVAAHAYGTSQLLLHMQHAGKLANLSDEAGKRARTNSEALISVQRSEVDYKQHPERVHIVPGTSSVTACIQADEQSTMGPVYYGVGSNAMALLYTSPAPGAPNHPLRNWLAQLISHPIQTVSIDDPRNWSQRGFNMLCMRDHDDWLDLYWKDGMLRSKPGSAGAPPTFLEIANEVGKQIAAKLSGQMAQTWFAVAGKATSSHFIGGMTIADSPVKGAIDPYQRVFGHPGLHIMDGSVIAANPGVNPSLTIAALAERAMSFWPNKGETDPRPPLGSGYNRIKPVMPQRPAVPAGAPAEYRLSATEVSDRTITYQPAPRREPRPKPSPVDGFRVLGNARDLADNSVEPFYLEDLKRRVSVVRVDGKLYAFDDLCPHSGAPLSAGLLTGRVIMSQCDGSQYDVTTGAVVRGPATEPLAKYEVREQDGEIQLRV